MRVFLVAALAVCLGPVAVQPFQHHTQLPLDSVTWRAGANGVSTAVAEADATTKAPAAAAPGAPGGGVASCDEAEYREFDFWLGDWDVTAPNGQAAGRNSITRELNGCVLHEHWAGTGGLRGESFNTWDRTRRRWHQTWVSSTGTLLLLEGALVGGAMQMSGETIGAKGPVLNRITWTPSPGGSVRQLWETSADRGKTWQVAFDGRYRRARTQ